MGIFDKIKQVAVDTTDKAAASIKETAAASAQAVKETATASAQAVKETTTASAQAVKETATAVKETATASAQSIQETAAIMKPQIIKQAASINYGTVGIVLQKLKPIYSVPPSVILSMVILQTAADEYKTSSDEDKDDKFLSCIADSIDAAFFLTVLEPLAKFVPGGTIIVSILKMLFVKNKNDGAADAKKANTKIADTKNDDDNK
jgi:hypothetical protein